MSNFQSYLIIGNDHQSATTKLIAEKGAKPKANSPDLFVISPIKVAISIDQIRELKGHIYQKPLTLPYKFVIIEQAHKLTPEAQNALLKILEEPPTQAVIILQAVDKTQLLPTIISRVVIISSVIDHKVEKKDLDLESITQIEDPISWLDEKIIGEYQNLIKNITTGKSSDLQKATDLIQTLSQTKQAIESNVNTKFALANLLLQQ